MREAEARQKIRELLSASDVANDNAHVLSRLRRPLIITLAIAAVSGAGLGIYTLATPSPTVSVSASNNSIAAAGSITINNTIQDKPLRPWGTLSASERQQIRAEAYALFPATLMAEGNRTWTPIVGWMARRHGVNATNIRDIFRSQHDNLPRFYARLLDDRQAFKQALAGFDRATLAEAWGATPPADVDGRFAAWLDMATPSIRETLGAGTDAYIKKLQTDGDD